MLVIGHHLIPNSHLSFWVPVAPEAVLPLLWGLGEYFGEHLTQPLEEGPIDLAEGRVSVWGLIDFAQFACWKVVDIVANGKGSCRRAAPDSI
jgi:hypothetical protein